MKKIRINAEITKFASMEIEVDDETFFALQTGDPQDVISGDLDAAWEAANDAHNNIQYGYQLVDAENNKIIVDWVEDPETACEIGDYFPGSEEEFVELLPDEVVNAVLRIYGKQELHVETSAGPILAKEMPDDVRP